MAIYQSVRALEVLPTGEYGYVRIAVGQGTKTKVIPADIEEAEAFAAEILESAKEARANQITLRAEHERLRADTPEAFEDDPET